MAFRFFSVFGFRGHSLVIALPYVWLLTFFLCPFFIVLKISLSEPTIAQPPYFPMIESLGEGTYNLKISFYNYIAIISDNYYAKALLSSIKIAAIATLCTLIIAFPMAYAMAKAPKHLRSLLLMLVILPFWSSFLIRVYALIGILKDQGLLNSLLLQIGVINEPLQILNTDIAVYIGITYSYLPFMVLPIYASLEKFDWKLLEAAIDLGATRTIAFWRIVVPLSKSGIIAGCFLVFIPAIGEFVIPDLLGGADTIMIGKVMWTEFFNNTDWTMASALAIILLFILVLPIVIYQRIQDKLS
ncbi:MAG: ABC transporter permease subunit [Gammaproteobacteria bacterium]|nr:ABC transporter permease subunit [Gammaproteobacteria bacterium]